MQKRWIHLWQQLGTTPPAGSWEQLSDLYNTAGRHYHNLTHIQDCLRCLDLAIVHPVVSISSDDRSPIELAIWFHDVIYDPQSLNNELRSAEFAHRTIQKAGLDPACADLVYQLILATSHHPPVIAGMAKAISHDYLMLLLLDIDLAILGSPPATFEAYEVNIRQEYAWVPEATFQQKRIELLQAFLDRPNIYQTAYGQATWESAARRNLAQSIAQLASK